MRYNHLIYHGRDVPHCPILIRGRPGFVYSLEWFEHFATNLLPGLQFCGLTYEGQAVEMCKALPAGGVDVLDTPVYWLLPNGDTKCCSARVLHTYRSRLGLQADNKDEHEAVGRALGFAFLGGRCDATDLLADPGRLQEQKWSTLQWQLPSSSMDVRWWLTNLPFARS